MTLFDEPDELDDECATAAQVAQLKMYGYRPEVVRKWTRERAATALGRVKADEKATRRRASSVALQADLEDGAERQSASLVERAAAAEYLSQSLGANADELYLAVTGSIYVLTDEELRGLAASLVPIYRSAGEQPAAGAA